MSSDKNQADSRRQQRNVGLPLLRLREAEIDALARRLARDIYIDVGLHSVPLYERAIAKALHSVRER